MMIYTILADDTPIIVLEATGVEARELIRERWFISELAAAKVGGQALFKKKALGCAHGQRLRRNGPLTIMKARA